MKQLTQKNNTKIPVQKKPEKKEVAPRELGFFEDRTVVAEHLINRWYASEDDKYPKP